jgi:hypothetical protein
MPGKPLVYDSRADFRGGRNTTVSPDDLNPTELVDSTNARLANTLIGAIMKRTGSQRFHAAALPTPVTGLTQWDGPSGKQTVAIANGSLWWAPQGIPVTFTQVTPGTLFQTTGYVEFVPFRAATSGAPLILFISDGANLYTWDGTTLTLRTGTNNVPATGPLASYHTRLFAVNPNFLKTLFWSIIGNGTDFTTGTSAQGGSALVDVLTGNSVIALEVVGMSLLPFTNYSIVRFRGYSNTDINITQNTEGVSADIGLVGQGARARVEQVIAFISDKGPYFCTEMGLQAYGVDVENDFLTSNTALLSSAIVSQHKGRREIWNLISGAGDGGLLKTVLVYNTRQQNWCGPFTYPFGIVRLAPYIDASGLEWIMSAGSDGFIRHMDIGGLDDVHSDGTGGTAYTMNVELAPLFFSVGPGLAKAVRRVNVQARLDPASAMHVLEAMDDSAPTDMGAITGLDASRSLDYRVDMSDVGHRLRLIFNDASSTIPIITGVVAEAYNYGRPE